MCSAARTLLLAAAYAISAAAKGSQLRVDGGVLVLNDESIDQALDKFDVLMIEFYAPWCGHCKQLAPKYKEAATKLRDSGVGVGMAKVDATKAEKCSERWKIESFPQMWTFTGGDKKGERPKLKGEVQELVKHMTDLRNKNEIKKPQHIKSKKAAQKFGKSTVAALGIFDSDSGKEFNAFANMAQLQNHRGHMKFGYSTSEEIAAVFEVTAPAVVLIKNYDDGNQVAPENILTSAGTLSEWITATSLENVCDLGSEGKSDCGNKHPMTIFIGGAKHKDEKKEFAAAAKAIRESGKEMYFGRMSKSHKAVKEFFEIDDDELPTVVVTKQAGIYDGSKVKYFIDKNEYPDITADVVAEVVDTYFAGDMEPTIKSSEPADDEDKALKEIVGMEFQERVLDSEGTDVMLMFYAPWCSMCKKLKPHYEQVAEVFKDIDSVMVAKMDATSNDADVEGISVSGYPTLYFFKGNNKKPVLFDGWSDLDVEKFKDYIKREVSTPYDTSKYGSYEKIVPKEEDNDQPMAPKQVGASADAEDDAHDVLKVLVGKNFKERVLDSDQPWMVDFYAPWCGHCKTLMPKIKELAKTMQGHTNVGKCDLTANDIASIHPAVTAEGRGYPMLMFFQEDKAADPLVNRIE